MFVFASTILISVRIEIKRHYLFVFLTVKLFYYSLNVFKAELYLLFQPHRLLNKSMMKTGSRHEI